jgi:TonB family protein
MYTPSRTELFSTLPDPGMPWGRFLFSFATHFAALFALLTIGLMHPLGLDQPLRDYHFIRLVETPPVENQQPAPVRFLRSHLELAETPSMVLRPSEEPLPHAEKPVAVPPPKVEMAAAEPLHLPASAASLPRQLVKTNVFSTGSSAVPTLSRVPRQLQTGGFGDPNGVPSNELKNRPVTIAQSGSFDLPVGEGYGNGTGGKTGAKGVVASAGFGSGTAVADATRPSVGGSVRQGSFGDVQPAALTQAHNQQQTSAAMVPPEVTFKPVPVYTEEARKLRIEGEVLVEVKFESSGQIQILRVLRGLGHGLDENAVKAAEKIRVRPARRNGEATDTTAVLHILFQLA